MTTPTADVLIDELAADAANRVIDLMVATPGPHFQPVRDAIASRMRDLAKGLERLNPA